MHMGALLHMLLKTGGETCKDGLKLSELVEILEDGVADATHQSVTMIAGDV